MKANLEDGLGAPSAGRTILIIEDHDDAREALRALLELEGHRVAAAATGPRGLELAVQQPPDVAERQPLVPQAPFERSQAGRRAWIDQRHTVITGKYGGRDHARTAAKLQVDEVVVHSWKDSIFVDSA